MLRRLVPLVAALLALAGPVLAEDAGAPHDAGALDAGDGTADEAERLRDEVRALDAFAGGQLGDVRSNELFAVDLRDDVPVKRRALQVTKELRVARAEAGPRDAGAHAAPDAGVERAELLDGPVDPGLVRRLRVAALEVRERILVSPHDARLALLAAEQTALQVDAREKERARIDAEAARAEEARRRALETAEVASTKADRDLAQARAAIEAARGAQMRFGAELLEHHRTETLREAALRTTTQKLAAQGAALAPHGEAVDALYDRVIDELVALRSRSRELLGALDEGPRAPRPSIDLAAPEPRNREAQAAVETEGAALVAAAQAMDGETRELAWSELRATMSTERELNDLRIMLLDRISADKRSRTLGLGLEGRRQLLRELDRLRLEARWLRASGGELARSGWQRLREPREAGRLSLAFLSTLFVLWAVLFARGRIEGALRIANALAARSARRRVVLVVERITAVVGAIGREVVTLLGVLSLPWLVAVDWRHGFWNVPYALLLWLAIYRLAVNATYRGLAWAASRGTTMLEAPKILASVRLAMRFVFGFAVLLAGAGAVLGRGYLYTLVVRLGSLGAVLVGYTLVRWWRADIANAYLRLRPSGAFSDVVRRTRHRGVGFFVTIAAFVVLLLSAIVRTGRGFVLGFEHSRKALAYLFRRRLERQGEHEQDDEPRITGELLASFTEDAVEDPELLLAEHFPGLDALGPLTLVVGRTGYGKSSWLAEARRRLGIEGAPAPVALRVRDRSTRADDVVRVLAKALGIEATTRDALVAALLAGPARVVTIDDAHLWFLRGVGARGAWDALSDILVATVPHMRWVVAVAHYPWEFLRWTLRGDGVFRTVVRLRPWSEPDISALIERRTAASGLEVGYEALLEDEIESIEGVDDRARMLSTARDYNRLIWDYAEGSPRVAMHVWGRSLVPDGPGRVRVRLFARPTSAWLDALGEEAKFTLAAIVWHEQIDAAEASSVLRFPLATCADAIARLVEVGAAEPWTGGRVRIGALWWPPVVRYLRRKHLIET